MEELLAETIEAAKRAGPIKASNVRRVIVGTTVTEEAIAHPTDSRPFERCREHVRQTYNRGCHGRPARPVVTRMRSNKTDEKTLRTLRSRVVR